MRFLAELQLGDERLGGKARSLAELAAAGLPTPAGFVVTDALFRGLCPEPPRVDRVDEATLAQLDRLRAQLLGQPWPAGFEDELAARLAGVRADRFSVRSSFATEDRPGRLAAGVFESRVDVPAERVAEAMRQVLASAIAPSAVAYALADGQPVAAAPVAVLVHAYAAGESEGSAAFVPAADTGARPQIMVRRGQLPAEAGAALAEALAGLAAARGPIEVEWVLVGGGIVYLQARPFVPPPPAAPWPGFRDLDAADPKPDEWCWDQAHNPLPLSLAQAGLVELVDERCHIGIRQRVLGGYLFYRRDDRPLPAQIPCEEAEQYFADLRDSVEARLAAAGSAPALEDALAIFLSAYEPIFGVLQPALGRAHARLRSLLEKHAPAAVALLPELRASVTSVASERLELVRRMAVARPGRERARALADYLARFGDEAGGWDVSFPTYAEEPSLLPEPRAEAAASGVDWLRARDDVEAMLSPGFRPGWRELLDISRRAVALGEADDWLYAKTQAALRRALLAFGRQLVAGGHLAQADDVFHLPLPLARSMAGGMALPADLAAIVEKGRQSWAAARRAPPPSPGTTAGRVVRGIGVGGRAVGRVVRHRPGTRRASAPDAVLVASTLLPTAGLVVETGGLLDHVAAQARERQLPAVVGAAGALAAFTEGDWVLVDGDRGLVVAVAVARPR
jgi:phosphohistidine swiveling domain-containing protein